MLYGVMYGLGFRVSFSRGFEVLGILKGFI